METLYKFVWRSLPIARHILRAVGPLAISTLALGANFVFQINFGIPALHIRPMFGLVWQIVLWSIFLPFSWCLYYCCTAKPWDPKMMFSIDPEDTTTMKHCEKCNDIKPPRAHHCSLCDRCILRMDHHCIWLGTCIGEHNYKSFILMLIYAIFLSIFYVCSTFRVMRLLNLPSAGPGAAIVWYLLLGIIIMTTPFVAFHLYLVLKNRTTIEFFSSLTRSPNSTTTSLFDMGYSRNWRDVFGLTLSDWLVPTVDVATRTKFIVKKRSLDV